MTTGTVAAERPRLGRRCLTVLLVSFGASRAIAYAFGVRFDDKQMQSVWQLLDPALLRHDLLSSLWHLHSQPPLFNAFVGVVLHLPSRLQQPAFALSYLALGVLLMLSLASLMVELGVSRTVSTAVTVAFVVSPSALLYENWLFYTYPTAAILTFAALALLRWSRSERRAWGVLFFSSLATLALIRSTWHLAWMVLIVAIALAARRAWRREVLLAAMVPLLLVVSLYVKNAVMFGSPTASSWQGMTLAYVTTLHLSDDERHRMVDDGELSKFALVAPFARLAFYDPLMPPRAPTGVAALDQRVKGNGDPNFNNIRYVDIDAKYMSDALVIARTHPSVLLSGIGYSANVLLRPSADYFALQGNRDSLGWWYTGYVTVVEGRLGTHTAGGNWGELFNYAPKSQYLPASRVGVTIALLYLLASIGGAYSLVALARRRFRASSAQLTVCFISLTVVWSTLGSLLVGSGESNRFRFEIDPLAIVLAAWTVQRLIARRRRRGAAGLSPVA